MMQSDVAALTQAAIAALAGGDAARARDLLEQVVAAGHAHASEWLALAQARSKLGDQAGKSAAIDAALAVEPGDLGAMLAKADHLAAEGDVRAASAFYSAALRFLPRIDQLPSHLRFA